MSTNLRKAQKHMQRAKELLNQSQLGFGAPPESSSKRKREHVSEERIETNKEMRDKIKQRVEHEEYTLLQDMIDTGQHTDEYKRFKMDKMNKFATVDDLKKNMMIGLTDEAKMRLQDKEVTVDEFKKMIFFEHAMHSVKTNIQKELSKRVEHLINEETEESFDELKHMILARGIFARAVSNNKKLKEMYKQVHENKDSGLCVDHNCLIMRKVDLLNLIPEYKFVNDARLKLAKEREQEEIDINLGLSASLSQL